MMVGDNSSNILVPTVLWAQRRDLLYITLCVGDVKDKTLNLTEDALEFKGKSNDHSYQVTLEFHGQIAKDESKQQSTDREIVMVLKKKDPAYWPQLLKNHTKQHWLKTDFNRWRDEDDSEDDEMGGGGNNFEQMMSQMGSFDGADLGGGAPDADADGEPDSDDEDLPDLE